MDKEQRMKFVFQLGHFQNFRPRSDEVCDVLDIMYP